MGLWWEFGGRVRVAQVEFRNGVENRVGGVADGEIVIASALPLWGVGLVFRVGSAPKRVGRHSFPCEALICLRVG